MASNPANFKPPITLASILKEYADPAFFPLEEIGPSRFPNKKSYSESSLAIFKNEYFFQVKTSTLRLLVGSNLARQCQIEFLFSIYSTHHILCRHQSFFNLLKFWKKFQCFCLP